MTVSERAQLIKDHFGWNNVELGKEAGVSKQAVGKWISGESAPSYDALIALKKRHNINDAWFLNGEGEMIVSQRDALSPAKQEAFELIEGLTDAQAKLAARLLRQLQSE